MAKMSKEVSERVKMLQSADWEFAEETPEYILMEKKQEQSVGVHIVLALFTLGIGNLIYWLCKRKPKQKKVMK